MKLGNLFSTNLSKGQPCGRPKCHPCENSEVGKAQNCKARSVLYMSSCNLCNLKQKSNPTIQKLSKEYSSPEGGDAEIDQVKGKLTTGKPTGRSGIYIGESSRSLAERSAEHLKDGKDFSKRSHMVKHWMNVHPNENSLPPFTIKIIKQYKDCLSRQVGEAISILLSNDNLLNSKNEYLSNCISRVSVEEDVFERKSREAREEEEERQEDIKLEEFKREKSKRKREPGTSRNEDVCPKSTKRNENVPVGRMTPKRRKTDLTSKSPDQNDEGFLEGWLDWWEWSMRSCHVDGNLKDLG